MKLAEFIDRASGCAVHELNSIAEEAISVEDKDIVAASARAYLAARDALIIILEEEGVEFG